MPPVEIAIDPRQQSDANSHPKDKNARHPQSDIDAGLPIDEEPQPHADHEAGEGCN